MIDKETSDAMMNFITQAAVRIDVPQETADAAESDAETLQREELLRTFGYVEVIDPATGLGVGWERRKKGPTA